MFKSKWRSFLPFLPLLVLLVVVNIFGDAGNRFHSYVDFMVDALLDGKPAYITSGNLEERDLRYSYILKMSDDISSITIGGSNVIYITCSDTGEKDFVNLGVSRGGFYDALAQLAVMKIHGKRARRIIIGPQEWYFNRKSFTMPDYEDVYKKLKPYTDYMISCINGDDINSLPIIKHDMSFGDILKTVLSLSYFQVNVKYITGSNMLRDARYGVVTGSYDGQYYMPDGSRVYSRQIAELEADNVLLDAQNATFANYDAHIDSENAGIFEKLIEYLLAQGVKIDIYLSPLAPALWDKLDPKKHPFFPELEEYLRKTAEKYGLRIIGSYNPYNVGITNADFYDTRHIRRGHISKYFNLK